MMGSLSCGSIPYSRYVFVLISVPVFLILAHRYEPNCHAIIEQQRNLRIFKGDSAEISSRRSRLLVALDGEVETMQSLLHYRTRPGGLRVFAPAQTAA